ncbi:hypothetical protein BCV70DRAFT_202462 [Testicularia cyperi]|uniref:DNA-(apurinic or apyrimidinic site) endonuclease n=1 Tax=Testicularia cyperi TaxID=1882483 RepID=A0A317XIQ8_9BASI|nr:hypothetical protein BCV70DRAFT_202462 [Testicularia cyperi]
MPPRTSARVASTTAIKRASSSSSSSNSAAAPPPKRTKSAPAAPEPSKKPAKKTKGRNDTATEMIEEEEPAEMATVEAKKSRKKAVPDSDSPAAPKAGDTLADPTLPKNTEMPRELEFARPAAAGAVRIAAWNITSLKSSEPKGLMRYIAAEDADVLVLSETKVNDVPIHPGLTAMYKYQYWGIGKTKGYAGLAVLSKLEPLKVTYGLPGLADQDTKGRIVTLEFEHTHVIGTYAVNAGEGLKTMETKQKWNEAFAKYVAQLDGGEKGVIWCGDLNVVLDERDLAAASKKWNKSPGYTAQECDAHHALLAGAAVDGALPLVDVWRHQHPHLVGHYTFYGWRGFCRSKGIGWRLDSFIVSKRIVQKALDCQIRHECYGASDHVPIYCDFAGPL